MNINDRKKSYDDESSYQATTEKSRNQSKKTEISASSGDDAQKKFGNAKSISSDMYFGNASTPDASLNSILVVVRTVYLGIYLSIYLSVYLGILIISYLKFLVFSPNSVVWIAFLFAVGNKE